MCALCHCNRNCDHCQPEAYHPCVRPVGHDGYCSCVSQPGDLWTTEPKEG